jgi:hypothetical protein
VLLGHGAEHVDSRPGTRVAAPISTAAPTGLRLCGMVEEPPLPGAEGSNTSRLGLHQQADITAELAQAAGDQAQHRGKLHQAVALGVPGLLGQGQLQLFGQRFGHRHRLAAECRQAAGGTAELQHQQARAQFLQTLAVRVKRPAHRQIFMPRVTGVACCNQVRPPSGVSACCRACCARVSAKRARSASIEGTAQLQHQASVHHILTGGAQCT